MKQLLSQTENTKNAISIHDGIKLWTFVMVTKCQFVSSVLTKLLSWVSVETVKSSYKTEIKNSGV